MQSFANDKKIAPISYIEKNDLENNSKEILKQT